MMRQTLGYQDVHGVRRTLTRPQWTVLRAVDEAAAGSGEPFACAVDDPRIPTLEMLQERGLIFLKVDKRAAACTTAFGMKILQRWGTEPRIGPPPGDLQARVTLRLEPADVEWWEARARADGLVLKDGSPNLSEVLRRALRDARLRREALV